MNSKESSTFCSVPWTQLATNSSGYFRVCCNALPVKNLVRDDQGSVLAIYKNSVDQVWNAPTYQKIRNEMLSSLRPEMCARCFREEDSGVESARQRWNRRWPLTKEPSTVSTMGVQYVDLRLGNLCNLKCRMCNPYSSSKWVEEWNTVAGMAELVPNGPLSDQETQRLQKMDWPDDEKTWKNLMPILSTVEEIYLTGGEPFLSLKQIDLLDWLIKIGRAKEIVIKYNTNVTLFPERLVSRWQQFKSIRLNLSIDGVGALNEYIRYPAKWEQVEKNLQLFIQLQKAGTPLEISIHTTVLNYNILKLSSMILYFQKQYQITPYLNILNHPACLNIRSLPANLKNEALSLLEPLQNEKDVAEVMSYMMAEDWSERYWPEFINYTNQLDKNRTQKVSQELSGLNLNDSQ